jgi:DNA-directed RNA polymerase subunit beta'
VVGQDLCARFLDDIKDLGFRFAFKGGLSFNLSNVNIPDEKEKFIKQAQAEVDEIWDNYNNGFITNNERYNQVIDIWTRINSRLADTLLKQLKEDQQGFNPVYMMLDSGARGSKEQIRQLGGMRGLMAKPQKNLSGGTGEIIENPILSNFKEGLSVIEYFISTHGARKGLADTALKTADAGYLTRRLHDVAQDVVVNEDDCGTLRGIPISALKDNEEVVETLYERILGRTSVHDIYEPLSGDLICRSGEEINEEVASKIEESPIEIVEIRSVLTCESRYGVCTKCYGRSMSTGRKSNIGDSVGVIAAQSIGEPGTQLTLRTFHVGGTASNIATESQMVAKFAGILEFEEIRTTELESSNGNETVVVGRQGEIRILDSKTRTPIVTINIPYGAHLKVKDGKKVEKGDPICTWDPYNAVIISEFNGKLAFENIIENVNYKEESDEQTGHKEKVIVESRDKTKIPSIIIKAENKDLGSKEYNLPVGAHIIVEAGHKIKAGEIIAKIPRVVGKTRDITGGLPRVTELFEARNPSNPAIVTEIDGVVTFGGIKRGNREIMITSKDGEQKKYLVPLSKHILVQENDFVKAGSPLSDGSISPQDILRIEGPLAVQRYILNGIMEVYRLQGVKINDKHVETIIRQMMKHIEIVDPGDTTFLEGEFVSRWDLKQANDWIFDKKVVIEAGDSNNVKPGQIISIRKLRDENSQLKRKDMRLIEVRDAQSATVTQIIMGITKASLGTHSFMSAASFQETTKVLNEAAISGKVDRMLGLKENVIVGHLIPAGTGHRDYEKLIVGSKEEFEALMASKED